MKKKNSFLTLMTLALSLGVVSLFASNNKTIKTKAATISDGQLYVKVTDISQLTAGCTVTLGYYDTFLGSLAGNPIYTMGYDVDGANSDCSKVYFSGSKHIIPMSVEVEQRTVKNDKNEDEQINVYFFKSVKPLDQESNSYRTNGRYLSYGQSYTEDGHNIQTHGDIAFRSNKTDHETWTVRIDNNADAYAHIQYFGEKYSTEIQYRSGYARANFGYYSGGYNFHEINIYRKVELSYTPDFLTIQHQDQEIVTEGDYLDLSGFQVRVTVDGMTFYSSYNDEPGFYTISPASYNGPDYKQIPITYCGWTYRAFADIVEVEQDYEYYYRINSSKGDYRGTYVLSAVVTNESKNYFVDTEISSVHDKVSYDYYNTTAALKKDYAPQMISIDSVQFNIPAFEYTIRIKNVSGTNYMFLVAKDGSNVMYNNNGLPGLTTTLSASAALTIDSNLYLCIGGQKLVYHYLRDMIIFSSNPSNDEHKVNLFKKSVDETSEASAFVSSFNTLTTANCDPNGATSPTISSSDWAAQASLFNSLSADAQGYLANLTYMHNQEAKGSDEDIIDRYDYIISKYGVNTYSDFILRGQAGTLQTNYVAPPSERLFENSAQDTTNIIIIVVISAITIASIAVLISVKKRKQD